MKAGKHSDIMQHLADALFGEPPKLDEKASRREVSPHHSVWANADIRNSSLPLCIGGFLVNIENR